MRISRAYHASTAVGSFIYVSGGTCQDSSSCDGCLSSVEVYDTGTGLWSTITSMSVRRTNHATATVGTRVYVVGGTSFQADGTGDVLDFAEMYDTETRQWTQFASPPRQSPVLVGIQVCTAANQGR